METAPIENHGGLLARQSADGELVTLGYIIHFGDHGDFEPNGRADGLTSEMVETHNAILSRMEVDRAHAGADRLVAYVTGPAPWDRSEKPLPRELTTWTGSKLGTISHGRWHWALNTRRVWIHGRVGDHLYGGYRTETRDLVFLRRLGTH